MILIADSGSTKTQWVLLDGGKVVMDVTTKGFNPYYYKQDELEKALYEELHDHVRPGTVTKIYFYGAGCSTQNNCLLVKNALQKLFVRADIFTGHDLDGAAVALLQDQEGIACILGTGSNSCMWDGVQVTEHVPSLGYLLGDEGSGTYIGKLMLQKLLYGEADEVLIEKFYKEFNLDFESALHRIYGEPNPNKFMSSLSKFVGDNIRFDDCKQVVKQAFNDFIDKQVSKYPGYQERVVSFTGSVAYFFSDILKEVLKERGITLGIIRKNPMEGLIEFHAKMEYQAG